MTDPEQTLSYDEIREAGLDDWRVVLGTLRASFGTGSFSTGLALVDRIGAAAEEADHHPDVTLTYPEVQVSLSSHDVGGITSRDVDLARRISGFAADAGVAADPAGLRVVELGLDSTAPGPLGPFYSALLGGDADETQVTGSSGQVPDVWFQTPSDEGTPLADPAVPQRWHLDVWVPADQAEAVLEAVVAGGGRLVSDAEAPSYWVVEDAEGNRSCICTDQDRG